MSDPTRDALREWLNDPLRDYLDERDRAYLAALSTTPAPLDVDRLTTFLVAAAVHEGAHGDFPTIRAQAEWMVAEWSNPHSLTNLQLTQPLPDSPMHRAIRKVVRAALEGDIP